MGSMASPITSLTLVYLTVYSGADQTKHQSSASLAFVWGIHRRPVNSPHKGLVTRKMFPFDDVIMTECNLYSYFVPISWLLLIWRGKEPGLLQPWYWNKLNTCVWICVWVYSVSWHCICPFFHTRIILRTLIVILNWQDAHWEALMPWACKIIVQYIPRTMHTVFAFLCFVGVIHWLIVPYPSGLLHWHCGNLTIAPVPAKQPWWIWINNSCEFIMNDCITTTKQSTSKPCAYFLGYTVCSFITMKTATLKPQSVTTNPCIHQLDFFV